MGGVILLLRRTGLILNRRHQRQHRRSSRCPLPRFRLGLALLHLTLPEQPCFGLLLSSWSRSHLYNAAVVVESVLSISFWKVFPPRRTIMQPVFELES